VIVLLVFLSSLCYWQLPIVFRPLANYAISNSISPFSSGGLTLKAIQPNAVLQKAPDFISGIFCVHQQSAVFIKKKMTNPKVGHCYHYFPVYRKELFYFLQGAKAITKALD
jgi:hypothetical protein